MFGEHLSRASRHGEFHALHVHFHRDHATSRELLSEVIERPYIETRATGAGEVDVCPAQLVFGLQPGCGALFAQPAGMHDEIFQISARLSQAETAQGSRIDLEGRGDPVAQLR